jgi:hypothetical protein
MIKKIAFPLMSIFLVLQSWRLLENVQLFEGLPWYALFFMAWILNMFVTGIFAFTGFAYPTQNLLPFSYYQITNPKNLKAVYSILKVGLFRKFLLATVWRKKVMQKQFFDGTRDGVSNLDVQSKKSEFGHLLPFIILSVVSIYFIGIGMYLLSAFTMFWNFMGNLYPILLQRHHRMRVQRLMKYRARKSA